MISITKVKFRWTFRTSNGTIFIRVHNISSFECSAMILAVNGCLRKKSFVCESFISCDGYEWKDFRWYSTMGNFIIQTSSTYFFVSVAFDVLSKNFEAEACNFCKRYIIYYATVIFKYKVVTWTRYCLPHTNIILKAA